MPVQRDTTSAMSSAVTAPSKPPEPPCPPQKGARDFLLRHNVIQFFVLLFEQAVANFCHPTIIAFSLGTLGLEFQLFNFLFHLLVFVGQRLFCFPLCPYLRFLFAQFGNLLFQLLNFR